MEGTTIRRSELDGFFEVHCDDGTKVRFHAMHGVIPPKIGERVSWELQRAGDPPGRMVLTNLSTGDAGVHVDRAYPLP